MSSTDEFAAFESALQLSNEYISQQNGIGNFPVSPISFEGFVSDTGDVDLNGFKNAIMSAMQERESLIN